jgi:molecular chaperone HtpG
MTDEATSKELKEHKRPLIGAFVLETLTLGMYGEPRHTLREYVQNSFDSIRLAERTKILSGGRGRVDITLATDSITIRDNGGGVPSSQAWTTLTSVGASKKDRQRDAGFRGIGRFAGMAYCDKLTFRTTFVDEAVLTTVTFDCKKLLTAMNPDAGGDTELAKLLDDSITFKQEETSGKPEHFFEVQLSGLSRAPEALTDPNEVRDYLSVTAPVDFSGDWEHRESLTADYKSYFGESMETIDIFLIVDGQKLPIFKPYGETYQLAKAAAELGKIEFIHGEDSLYWGWVGYLSESGAVTDPQTRGLRVRTRNIQVGGTDILEKLFAKVNPSYGRFSSYYVGEVHINPTRVVPNARRDGFEENPEWIEIQEKLRKAVCSPLAKEAYAASRDRQADIKKVVEDISALEERSRSLAAGASATYDQIVELMYAAKRLRRKAASALKSVEDVDETSLDTGKSQKELIAEEMREAAKAVDDVESQARMLIGQILTEDVRVDALKRRLRQEIIKEVLDIVNLFVDPSTYQKIKRRLER